MLRVGIDGYNLAMENGTGVATYGHELVDALRTMGHETVGIFGLPVPADSALREVAFFDALKRRDKDARGKPARPRSKASRYVRKLRSAWRQLQLTARPHSYAVPLTGTVQIAPLHVAFPPFAQLVTAAGLYSSSFDTFRRTGRFLSLRIPDPPDVMHWTYPVPVELKGSQNVYTLHDLVPLRLPYTTLDNKSAYRGIVAGCIARAAQICTVSEASRRDIVEQFRVDPARITNTYQTSILARGASNTDVGDDAHAIEGVFGLRPRGYFLYYGAIEPKKNVGRLIEAYLSMQSTTPLVIVGARAWQAEQELQLMPEGGASGAAGTYRGHRGQTIVRLDYLSRELLAKLVRGAKALVFPSLYEGFGLPVLEAMQLGTPVITSNTSSLPEVAGDAGILVDPYDVFALQAAMKRVDTDEALCRAMSARGLEQASKFSRERYQERLTELYDAALSRR